MESDAWATARRNLEALNAAIDELPGLIAAGKPFEMGEDWIRTDRATARDLIRVIELRDLYEQVLSAHDALIE